MNKVTLFAVFNGYFDDMSKSILFIIFVCFFNKAYVQNLNTVFGKNGITTVNFEDITADNIYPLFFHSNKAGEVYLSGRINHASFLPQQQNIFQSKLQKNGTTDLSFANNGFSFFSIGTESFSSNRGITAIVEDKKGRIISAGNTFHSITNQAQNSGIYSSVFLVRYLANGQPDNNFGLNGKAVFSSSYRPYIYPLNLYAKKILIQSDGKIVVGYRGVYPTYIQSNWILFGFVRFNENGGIDSSFGTNGFIEEMTSSKGLNNPDGMPACLQPDDKILMAETNSELLQTYYPEIYLYRFTKNGKKDLSYGTNGNIISKLPVDWKGSLYSMYIKTDSSLVLAGNSDVVYGTILQLKANGKLDSSFANNGIFQFNEQQIGNKYLRDIIWLSNGSMICATSAATNYTIFTITSNGKIDSNFAGGKIFFSHKTIGNIGGATMLTKDSAENIFALINYFSGNFNTLVNHDIIKISKTGVLKQDFNSTGIKSYTPVENSPSYTYLTGSSDGLIKTIKLKSGNIILAGLIDNQHMGFTKIKQTGIIDSTFGKHGKIIIKNNNPPPLLQGFADVIQLQDGKILFNLGSNSLFCIDSTGNIDTSFGVRGNCSITFPTSNSTNPLNTFIGFTELSNKKIFLVSQNFLARLESNGQIDRTFGDTGFVRINPPGSPYKTFVKESPDNRIFIAWPNGYVFVYLANGTPDKSFRNGIQYFDFNFMNHSKPAIEAEYEVLICDMQFQKSGKPVFLMTTRAYEFDNANRPNTNIRDIVLYRMNKDGSIDYTFGGYPNKDYIGAAHLKPNFYEEMAGSFTLTPDDNIVVAGFFNNGNNWDIGITQLNKDGTFDSSCAFKPGQILTANLNNVIVDPSNYNSFSYNPNGLLSIISGFNGSYLVGGTILNENKDFFVANFASLSSPTVNYKDFVIKKEDITCFTLNLNWQTDFECTVDSFFIEYSTDNFTYTKINSLKAVNTSGLSNYQLQHKEARFGANYYRLVLYAKDGSLRQSITKEFVIYNTPPAIIDWGNPVILENPNSANVILKWQTKFENESTVFKIFTSNNNKDFKLFSLVKANGNSNTVRDYKAIVTDLPRQKQFIKIIAEGSKCRSLVSDTLEIDLTKKIFDLKVSPNPVMNQLNVSIPQNQKGDLFIYNHMGNLMMMLQDISQASLQLNVSSYPAGTYYIRFVSTDTYVATFIKL